MPARNKKRVAVVMKQPLSHLQIFSKNFLMWTGFVRIKNYNGIAEAEMEMLHHLFICRDSDIAATIGSYKIHQKN